MNCDSKWLAIFHILSKCTQIKQLTATSITWLNNLHVKCLALTFKGTNIHSHVSDRVSYMQSYISRCFSLKASTELSVSSIASFNLSTTAKKHGSMRHYNKVSSQILLGNVPVVLVDALVKNNPPSGTASEGDKLPLLKCNYTQHSVSLTSRSWFHVSQQSLEDSNTVLDLFNLKLQIKP